MRESDNMRIVVLNWILIEKRPRNRPEKRWVNFVEEKLDRMRVY